MKTLTTLFLIAGAALAQPNNPSAPLWSLDANCATGAKLGGGTAFDNSTSIATFLNRATQTQNVAMYPTGCGVVSSAITIPPTTGNVTIDGGNLNNGFYVKSGSNAPAIANARVGTSPLQPFDPGTYPPFNVTPSKTNFGSIEIRNLTVNVNGGVANDCTKNVSCNLANAGEPFSSAYSKGYMSWAPPLSANVTVIGSGAFPASPTYGVTWAIITNGSSATDCTTRAGAYRVACYAKSAGVWAANGGTQNRYPWVTGIDISNLYNFRAKNVRIIDSPSYGFRTTNVDNQVYEDVIVERTAYDTAYSYDGIHVDGPAKNVIVRGSVFRNIHDDVVACNAPEGYGEVIENCLVDGIQLNTVYDGVNVYGRVNNTQITNVTGDALEQSLIRVLGADGYPTNNGPIINVTNSQVSFNTAAGDNMLMDFQVGGIKSITYDNVLGVGRRNSAGFAPFTCSTYGTSTQAGFLNIINSGIKFTATEYNTHGLVDIMSGCDISFVKIEKPRADNEVGGTRKLDYMIDVKTGGVVFDLELNDLNCYGFTSVLGPAGWTNITRVHGNALASSGCKITVPDSKVMNNTLYFSSNAAELLSIKYGTDGATDGFPMRLAMSTNTSTGGFGTVRYPLQTQYLGNAQTPGLSYSGYTTAGYYLNLSKNYLGMSLAGVQVAQQGTGAFVTGGNGSFCSGTATGTGDASEIVASLCLNRADASTWSMSKAGTSGSDAAIKVNNVVGGGNTPSVGTCGTIGTGSKNAAGFITSGTTGACTSVLTFSGYTATTGWSCTITNGTTANLIRQTGSTTTTATFEGTTVSGDVLRYACTAY